MRRKCILFITLAVFIFSLSPKLFAETSEKPIQIDRLTTKANFTLSWHAPEFQKNDFTLSLISPSGEMIDANNLPSNVSAVKVGLAPAYAFNIFRPEAGRWRMIIQHPSGIQYTAGCSVNSSLKFNWNFIDPTPSVDQPIIIEVTLNEPEPIGGAYVSAIVKKYKMKSVEFDEYHLLFSDDGTGDDRISFDGIYTGTFYETHEEGSCCFDVSAEGYTEKAGQFERKNHKCTVVSFQY